MEQKIISFARELEEQRDSAYRLWSWLPSCKQAEKYHGDYAVEYMPKVSDIIKEASMFISHGLNPNEDQVKHAGEYYECPCGEIHDETK